MVLLPFSLQFTKIIMGGNSPPVLIKDAELRSSSYFLISKLLIKSSKCTRFENEINDLLREFSIPDN